MVQAKAQLTMYGRASYIPGAENGREGVMRRIPWVGVVCAALAVAAGEPVAPQQRAVSPGFDAIDSENPGLEPGHDVERGPASDGERYRQWTVITEAEIQSIHPRYRELVEAIRAGTADKRVMREYWFLRSRLDPFDRPVPAGWRERGAAALRDADRTAAGVASWESAMRNTASTAGAGLEPRGVWIPIGPYRIPGRMTGLSRPVGEPDTLYAAAADGGVWRTRNRGATWENLTEFEETQSGGAILVDPVDPLVLWFGTGEGNGAIDNYPGIGVLKSVDGGQSWTASNKFSNAVRALAVHPDRRERVWAAGDAGCYVSTDGGATFATPDPSTGLPSGTGASAVVIAPNDADRVYCAIWVGGNNGIYRTTDGGATWSELSNGLPAGDLGRISLAVSRSNPLVLIAGLSVNNGRVFKSVDGGDTWVSLGGAHVGYCGGQCWYDNVVAIDSADPNVLYAGGVSIYASYDGGTSWSFQSGGVHVDHHALLTVAPGEVAVANDGGVYVSSDRAASWQNWGVGLDTSQYYGICAHPTDAAFAFGGTQDNGSHRRRIGDDPEWQERLGGDGGMCMTGPAGSRILIGEYQNTNLQRSVDDGETFTAANGGIGSQDPRSWVGPMVADPSNRLNMWVGTHRVYRSTDGRATPWSSVSNPLYFNQPVGSIAVAPTDSNRVYVGFNAGGLFRATAALGDTVSWTDIRGTQPLVGVRRLRVSPVNRDVVYLLYNGYGAQRIFRTADAGATWVNITTDLPDVPLNDVLIDPQNPSTLIVSTDLGVFRSDDDGASWYGWSVGLPTVAAIEMTYDATAGVLRVGTHGRSMWEWRPASATPVAVPDGGAVAGTPLRVERLQSGGMRVRWDSRSCVAHDYHLLWGDLASVASGAYVGAHCGLGTGGVADLPLPSTSSGNAYFLVVATTGDGTEGPHGFDGQGNPRPATGLGWCGITAHEPLASCP